MLHHHPAGLDVYKAIQWTQTVGATDIRVRAAIIPTSPTSTLSAYITTRIGALANAADVVASATVNVSFPASIDPDNPPMVTLFTGLDLNPGAYYLVLAPAEADSLQWFGDPSSSATVTAAPGFSLGFGYIYADNPDFSFHPSARYVEYDVVTGMFWDLTNGEDVPEPATLSLLVAGSILLALIRRKLLAARSAVAAAALTLGVTGQGFSQPSVIGGSWGQTLRVVIAADTSSSCSALVRLIGENRLPAAEKSFDLRPGQLGFVEVNLNRLTDRFRRRVELLPAVQVRSGRCAAAAEVIENFSGRIMAYMPGLLLPAAGRPLPPVGVAVSQFVRLGAARGFDPQPDPPKCAATLAFADSNGNPAGTSKTIDLAVGSFEVVDLDPGLLLPAAGDLLARRYVQPRLLLPAAGGGDTRGCALSMQVFDRVTGWTNVAYTPQ